ncbi:NAD(P)-dependent oxidoreductase [Pseudonocardia acaciae]|uniref:NAD(P)-dependent oxidoreductase n=1 Tax=Pseudonocardia acaciae TaxID=551276 RepID=UPI00048D80D7|nr:2-hydroxyacid dehydrogenase [Pseudonocardia acaciae]
MDTIVCLSPFTEEQVRELAGTDRVRVLLAPDPPTRDAVRELVPHADVLISDIRRRHPMGREILATMTRCRAVLQPSVGFDHIDHRAAAELGIPVANAAGFNRDAVADWTVMAILNVVRHGARSDREMRAGTWRLHNWMGRDLRALTVGILGLGNVGGQVADRLAGFGCPILFHDVAPRERPGCEPVSLGELLERADVVTVHVPLDDSTRGLVGEAELRRMRPGTILCNASRGPVVDEAALVAALGSGHLGGAALDVFEVEPLAAESPLRRMDNVFLSPHIAGGTVHARANMLESTGANLRRVLAGQEPVNVVNGVRENGERANG